MASVSGSIQLSVFWEGGRTYKNWSIDAIRMQTKNPKSEVLGSIIDDQALTFIKPFSHTPQDSQVVKYSHSQLKTLQLSARIFQTYKEYGEVKSRCDHLPIILKSANEEINDGDTLELRITHIKEEIIEAVFKKTDTSLKKPSQYTLDCTEEEKSVTFTESLNGEFSLTLVEDPELIAAIKKARQQKGLN